jgi:hypothetical protein
LPLEVEGKERYKIFEVKCSIRQESSLPAGFKGPLYETEFEKISPWTSASPQDFQQKMSEFKYRIAGVMLPRDMIEIQKIEKEMENESSDKLALK